MALLCGDKPDPSMLNNDDITVGSVCQPMAQPPVRPSRERYRMHRRWKAMIDRCYREKNHAFRYYGGRGIRVCERWLNSFEAFVEDMGPKPSPTHTLDRIDNNGNYEPANCRWATPLEQARNTSRNVRVTWRGQTQVVAAWSEQTGLPSKTILDRLRAGRSVEEALRTPAWGLVRPVSDRQRAVLIAIARCSDGHGATVRRLAKLLGIASTNGVACHIDALVAKGLVVRDEQRRPKVTALGILTCSEAT